MLEGTVHTPLGTVSKKTAAIGGAALAVLAGIVFYRSRQASQAANAAAAASTAGANTGIDPATGYAYGSAEDAAALSAQGSYINPTVPYAPGGGGGIGDVSGTPGPGGFTSNAQWAQYAESTLQSNGAVSDVSALSAAIGKYLTDQPVNSDQQSLINQAIAIAGYPPVSGPSGYPPSINTQAAPTPPAPVGNPGSPTNLRVYYHSKNALGLLWNAPNPPGFGYRVYLNGSHVADVLGTGYTYQGLKPNTTYTLGVASYNASTSNTVTITAKTDS